MFLVWQHACLSVCQAQGGLQDTLLQITPAITRALIDSLRQILYDHYIFPDTARKWAAYLEAQYKKGAYTSIKDPNELANRLQQDLQKAHHDGHFHLLYAPDMARNLADTTHMAERRRVG